MDNEVGTINWKACKTCVHSVPDGGCDSLDDNIVRDGDFMICVDYIPSDV